MRHSVVCINKDHTFETRIRTENHNKTVNYQMAQTHKKIKSIATNIDAISNSNFDPIAPWSLHRILPHASRHIRSIQLVQVLVVLLIYSDIQSGQQCSAVTARLVIQVKPCRVVHGVERRAVKCSAVLCNSVISKSTPFGFPWGCGMSGRHTSGVPWPANVLHMALLK